MSMMNANAAATTAMTANEPLDFELPEMGDSDFSNEEDVYKRQCRFPRSYIWGVWFWQESFWGMHPGFAKEDGIRARRCPAL